MSAAEKTPEELCAAGIEGFATASELESIQQRLRDDEAFRALYLAQMRCHALLAWRSGFATPQVESSAPSIPPVPSPHDKPAGRRLWLGLGAMLAACLLFGFYLLLANPGADFKVLASSVPELPAGTRSSAKQLSFALGSLKLELPSGEIIEIAGPATVEFLGKQRLRLQRGGMVIDTMLATEQIHVQNKAGGLLECLGKCSISAADDGNTEVAVFQGQAQWHSPALGNLQPEAVKLGEGQAIEISPQQDSRQLEYVMLRMDAPHMLQTRILGDSIVTSVTDNAQERGVKRFYTVTPRGMVPGAQPYPVMMRPRWQPLPEKPFPQELWGGDLVGTFNMDRLDPSRRIALEVSAPCMVYVMFDERTEVPAWLRTEFEPTAERLRSGPWNAENPIVRELPPSETGEHFVTYRVWKKQVTRPGLVELGAPRSSKEPAGLAMYGIVVKPLGL